MDAGSIGALKPPCRRVAVLNVVALTGRLLGKMPGLSAWAAQRAVSQIEPAFPAVTCTAQATYLTGCPPSVHGIVGNGWYFAEEAEIRFWRQSNHLVQAEKLWDRVRLSDPDFSCANLFWWFNMYSSVDISVTPRPMYPADGRKIPDIYTEPAALRSRLQEALGPFPLFDFWGPRASIRSSRWIASAARLVEDEFRPTLSLVYLPHLDYDLQRYGPESPQAVSAALDIDLLVCDLIRFYEALDVRVLVLSEYGITPVSRAVLLNRALREKGWLRVREELGRELLDPGASEAFAIADHQVAHVHVRNPCNIAAVRRCLEALEGVDEVFSRAEIPRLAHPRCGDLVAVAEPDAWFAYPYWLDERHAPDFARTVDIHRKPGYGPLELFLDPALPMVKARILWRLLQKTLGFRMLMDVIPLDTSLVRGTHGRAGKAGDTGPVLIGGMRTVSPLPATDIQGEILNALMGHHLNSNREGAR